MRKIAFLRAVSLLLLHAPIVAQPNYPDTTSAVQASNIIKNDDDPNARLATGPGLSTSPLESRLYAPLGQPWKNNSAEPAQQVNASTFSSARPDTNTYGRGAYSRTSSKNAYAALDDGSPLPAATLGSSFDSSVPNASPVMPATPYGSSSSYGLRAGSSPRAQPLEPIFKGTNEGYGIPAQPAYLFPGLVRFYIDQWVGSDYLYEMSSNIGVVVEVVNSVNFTHAIDAKMLKSHVEAIFTASGILPVTEAMGDEAPLPFFHVLIFIVPVGDMYVFNISTRLFEQVRLARLDYRLPGTWQAITWEKQELVVAPEGQLVDQLIASSKKLAETFTERVRYFRRLKQEQDNTLHLKCGSAAVPIPPQRDGDSHSYKSCAGFSSGCGSGVNIVGGVDECPSPQNSRSTQTSSGRCRAPCCTR